MNVNPYICYEGRCEEAIEFYKSAVGAEVNMMMRFNQMPKAECPGGEPMKPGTENKIMHAELKIGESKVFVSDGRVTGKPAFHGIALSVAVNSPTKAEKVFNGLSAGGKINMPLGKTFFAASFGMLEDKFGVGWMVIAEK
jgi:PhnB protein